jgi:hypothetical protein
MNWLHARIGYALTHDVSGAQEYRVLYREYAKLQQSVKLLHVFKERIEYSVREYLKAELQLQPASELLPPLLSLHFLRHNIYSSYLPGTLTRDVICVC